MINKILERTSCRDFLNKKISEENINKLKNVINSIPTSVNAQSFSAIFVTNQEIKKQLSEINWGQKHIIDCPLLIVFVADLNRFDLSLKNNNGNSDFLNSLESYTSAVVDATIAASFCSVAALELDIKSCFIGGIRSDIAKACNLLNIENKAIPILSLALGYESKKSKYRPKVNKVYDEKYNYSSIPKEIELYDIIMKKYYAEYFNLDSNYQKATASTTKKLNYKNQFETISNKMKIDFRK